MTIETILRQNGLNLFLKIFLGVRRCSQKMFALERSRNED